MGRSQLGASPCDPPSRGLGEDDVSRRSHASAFAVRSSAISLSSADSSKSKEVLASLRHRSANPRTYLASDMSRINSRSFAAHKIGRSLKFVSRLPDSTSKQNTSVQTICDQPSTPNGPIPTKIPQRRVHLRPATLAMTGGSYPRLW